MPVPGGDLRQEREHGVAQIASARDDLPGLARDEAVGLRVLHVASRDGADEPRQLRRIHLVVGRHHAGHVDALFESAPVAGHDRRAHARVLAVGDHLDPCVVHGARLCRGPVPRAVVDDVDAIDEVRDPAQGLHDQALLVVRGHDDGHALALEHQPEVAERCRRATNGSATRARIAPTRRPTSAPTRSDVRLERAVVFTAEQVRRCGSTRRSRQG